MGETPDGETEHSAKIYDFNAERAKRRGRQFTPPPSTEQPLHFRSPHLETVPDELSTTQVLTNYLSYYNFSLMPPERIAENMEAALAIDQNGTRAEWVLRALQETILIPDEVTAELEDPQNGEHAQYQEILAYQEGMVATNLYNALHHEWVALGILKDIYRYSAQEPEREILRGLAVSVFDRLKETLPRLNGTDGS